MPDDKKPPRGPEEWEAIGPKRTGNPDAPYGWKKDGTPRKPPGFADEKNRLHGIEVSKAKRLTRAEADLQKPTFHMTRREQRAFADIMRPPPADMSKEEAKDWVAKRMTKLSPHALWVVQQRLFSGDDKKEWNAALELLDRDGFSKKQDAPEVGNSPIIRINIEGALPWSRAKTVEVKDVTSQTQEAEERQGGLPALQAAQGKPSKE